MVNIQGVFKKYDINPNGSINRAIQNVSLAISEASDPFITSNQIISALGCKPVRDTIDAAIIAKCLIEQAILQREDYIPEFALTKANEKLANMKVNHPYCFVMKESTVEATATSKRGGDKKAKALEIFEANRDKKHSDIAKLIQMELGITFANAYYYVSRVFK
jgi:hypothetical protein